jgi:hypothetical protein
LAKRFDELIQIGMLLTEGQPGTQRVDSKNSPIYEWRVSEPRDVAQVNAYTQKRIVVDEINRARNSHGMSPGM